MPLEQAQQVLSRVQVKQALAVLKEERQAYPFTRTQRRLYNWFRISFWGFWTPPFAFIILVVSSALGPGRQEAAAVLVAILMALFFISLLLSVPGNLPLFWRTLRQFRLARRLRLLRLAVPAKGAWAWAARLLRWTALFVLAVAVVTAGVMAVREPISGTMAMLLVLTGLFYWFISYARKQLAALAALEPLLERGGDAAAATAGAIRLPDAMVQQIGDVEDQHIHRRRAEAIAVSADAPGGYALLRSRALMAEEASLAPNTQLQIEARVAGLAADPEPADAKAAGAGVWRVPAAGTAVEILYAVDHAARRIELHAIRPAAEEGASGGPAQVADA